jgi:hypothetical protein
MKLIPELLRRDMLTHVVIELKFLSCQGINERGDEFEEPTDNPRN